MKAIGDDNNSDNDDAQQQSCGAPLPGLPSQSTSTSVKQFDGSVDTW